MVETSTRFCACVSAVKPNRSGTASNAVATGAYRDWRKVERQVPPRDRWRVNDAGAERPEALSYGTDGRHRHRQTAEKPTITVPLSSDLRGSANCESKIAPSRTRRIGLQFRTYPAFQSSMSAAQRPYPGILFITGSRQKTPFVRRLQVLISPEPARWWPVKSRADSGPTTPSGVIACAFGT